MISTAATLTTCQLARSHASTSAATPHWDYTSLARHYDQRPGYDANLVESILQRLDVSAASRVADVGAGTGALTRLLCRSGAQVVACEPNAAMRRIGRNKDDCASARWVAAQGEALPLRELSVDLLAFGSSFNVLPAFVALLETRRVLRASGHWLALWNHRDLDDPLQAEVERCIRRALPGFDPGRRRQDPRPELVRFGGFQRMETAQQRFEVSVSRIAWLDAWRAHATLRNQAGAAFDSILQSIGALVADQPTLCVPYFTRAYWAQRS